MKHHYTHFQTPKPYVAIIIIRWRCRQSGSYI